MALRRGRYNYQMAPPTGAPIPQPPGSPVAGLPRPVPSTLARIPRPDMVSTRIPGPVQTRPVPRGLPSGAQSTLGRYRSYLDWLKAVPPAIPFAAAAAEAAPVALAGGLLGMGAYQQLSGRNWQPGAPRNLFTGAPGAGGGVPGFSSVPFTPGGTRATTRASYNIPGYGRQSITMPDFTALLRQAQKPEPAQFGQVPENVGAPGGGPIPSDGSSERAELARMMRLKPPAQTATTDTGGGPGGGGGGFAQPKLDFDFSKFDTLRKRALKDALAAINADYAAQDAQISAGFADLEKEYDRLMLENKQVKRSDRIGIESSAAGRGLGHSGIYAEGLAEALQKFARTESNIIGTYSTEEGSYGSEARKLESARKLAEQSKAAEIAAARTGSEREKLELEQLQAMLTAGVSF